MWAGLGDTQRSLLELLRGAPAGMSVDALSDELGVTVTAVRQHLTALHGDGLVERGATRASGGRPQQLYVLTEKAREGFPRQYSWFSESLVGALKKEQGSAKVEKLLRVLGDDVGASVAAPASAPLAERARMLAAKMDELGYEARVEKRGDKLEVTASNCVFHKLAERHPEVCAFDLGLIERVAHAKATHDECIVRGDAVCRFQLKKR